MATVKKSKVSDASSSSRSGIDNTPLGQQKRTAMDFFSEWRKGNWSWNRKKRLAIIDNLTHPKPGKWPGLPTSRIAELRPTQYRRDRRMLPPSSTVSDPEMMNDRQADRYKQTQKAVETTRTEFRPAKFTFRRILGRGGFGVAVLFEMRDAADRLRHVVVKTDIRGDPSVLRRERENMIAVAGAQHMVQRLVLQAMPEPLPSRRRVTRLMAAREFGGDLLIFLSRVVEEVSVFIRKAVVYAFFNVLAAVLWVVVTIYTILLALLFPSRGNLDPLAAAREAEEVVIDAALIPPLPSFPSTPDPDGPGEEEEDLPGSGGDSNLDPAPVLAPSLMDLWPIKPSLKARRRLDRRQDLIVLEYMRYGDLAKWIHKMAKSHQRFSEKVLWQMFQCFWRACIAMAYPGRFNPDGLDARNEQVPIRPESLPRKNRAITDPLVHFDLDPSNILVGYVDEHHDVPILTVSDLGLSMRPRSECLKDDAEEENRLWMSRWPGKRDRYLPEQSTEEWDYMGKLSDLKAAETAGNYSSHSNIFQVGVIMFELLTLCYPDIPFVARRYRFKLEGEEIVGWTYGHNLLAGYNTWSEEDHEYSSLLRHTVAWCMEYNPTKRPSLERLEGIIKGQVSKVWPDETDEQTRQWVEDFFGVPSNAPRS